MTNFLILFMGLSIVNVVFSTIRSIITIKGGKLLASLFSAGYFAFYNIMMIYTVMDFAMWQKCLITFACNVVGVFIVKFVEEKMRKDRLWKIEATFRKEHLIAIDKELTEKEIPHNYLDDIGKHCIVNMYCENQEQSKVAKAIIQKYNGKYFVSETKIL